LSLETLKAYELGRRVASRAQLMIVVRALNIDQRARNDLLLSAGYAMEPLRAGRAAVSRYLSLDEATEVVSERPWPSVVINEKLEILAANWLMVAVWGLSPDRLAHPVGRNVLTMTTERAFAGRALNWHEAVGGLIAMYKGHAHRAESLENPSTYFAALLELIYAGDPQFVREFLALWDATPPAYPDKVSWSYEIRWRIPDGGPMRFHCIASSVNEADCLDIDDWVPADAATWNELNALGLTATRDPSRAPHSLV
jgi:hypothetical protein